MPADLATVTLDDFAPLLEQTFEIATPAGVLPVTLKEARALGMAKRAGGAYSLIFVSAPGPYLQQAIYPVQHSALGTLEIFLVPIGPQHGGNGYEAVFT